MDGLQQQAQDSQEIESNNPLIVFTLVTILFLFSLIFSFLGFWKLLFFFSFSRRTFYRSCANKKALGAINLVTRSMKKCKRYFSPWCQLHILLHLIWSLKRYTNKLYLCVKWRHILLFANSCICLIFHCFSQVVLFWKGYTLYGVSK